MCKATSVDLWWIRIQSQGLGTANKSLSSVPWVRYFATALCRYSSYDRAVWNCRLVKDTVENNHITVCVCVCVCAKVKGHTYFIASVEVRRQVLRVSAHSCSTFLEARSLLFVQLHLVPHASQPSSFQAILPPSCCTLLRLYMCAVAFSGSELRSSLLNKHLDPLSYLPDPGGTMTPSLRTTLQKLQL